MVIVSCHGAQLAFVGIFCGFARARLERNQDLRNQQVAIRDTMLGATPQSCGSVDQFGFGSWRSWSDRVNAVANGLDRVVRLWGR